MTKTLYKVIIEMVENPTDEYKYNARIIKTIDGGNRYYYTGNGKFYKTLAEAEEYKTIIEREIA